MAEKKIKIIAENRKARHDFTIHETYEAGIELTGTEVKSLRAGKANMKDSYAQITKTAEVYVYNLHISPYDQGNRFNHEPLRNRRLLLHRAALLRHRGRASAHLLAAGEGAPRRIWFVMRQCGYARKLQGQRKRLEKG